MRASSKPNVRILLFTSLLGLLPACMPKTFTTSGQVYSRPAPYISATPYLHSYQLEQQQKAVQPAPVLYAQATTVHPGHPGLRGASQAKSEQFYSNYKSVHPQQPTRAVPAFKHYLDEGAGQFVQPVPARSPAVQPSPIFKHSLEEAGVQPILSVPAPLPSVQPSPTYVAPQYAPPPQLNSGSKPAADVNAPRQTYNAPISAPAANIAVQAPVRQSNVIGAPQTINPSEQSLRQSLGAALQNSPRLAIEDLKIQEAQEVLIQSEAQGKFKLDLNGVVGPTQSETTFSVVDGGNSDFRVNRGANLNLSLPIYQGGRIKAQNKVASVGIKEAEANFEIVETTVTEEAAIAHYNVVRDRQLIEVYERNVQLLKSQESTVSALLAAGENTITDQALIDSRLALIEVNLEQVRANLAASESTYKKLVGRPAPASLPVEAIALPDSLAEIKSVALQNNPRLKAAQTRVEAAQHNIDVAKSFNRPKLALEGVARSAEGQSDTIRRNSAIELLLNLNIPILSGGENKSRVREANLGQTRAMLESRTIYDDINERIEQLWASVQSARRSQAPNRAQIKAAQKAYEAISKQRDAGVATSLDVQTIEQTLLDARLNLIQAENIENVARFQLLSLMGVL